jgi:serine/threonine-protein kinase
MASLYLARRAGAAGFSRLVAIKVVHPRLSDDSGLIRMFVDEAKLTARIDHPNVVHVEELGEREGVFYLVMEYVHGCSLAQLMRSLGRSKRRLAPAVAVAICSRVAEGLHAAHETTGDDGQLLNLVHRDVSPQNILLSHKGHVKLIDFGIAKAKVGRQESNTRSLRGKVRYMAPEQVTTGRIDRRTDIYALGIVLWELLAMRRLFSGRTDIEVLKQVRKPEVVAPSRYATEVSPELDAVVLQALAPDPDDRFSNAKDLKRALVRALSRSAGIDSAHLADLLLNAMGDALDQERHELPDEVSRVLRAEQLRIAGLVPPEHQGVPKTESARPPTPRGPTRGSNAPRLSLNSRLRDNEDDFLPDITEHAETNPVPSVALGSMSPISESTPDEYDEGPTIINASPPVMLVHKHEPSRESHEPSFLNEGESSSEHSSELTQHEIQENAPALPKAPAPQKSLGNSSNVRPRRSWARVVFGYVAALSISMTIGVVLAFLLPTCDGHDRSFMNMREETDPRAGRNPESSRVAPISEDTLGARFETSCRSIETALNIGPIKRHHERNEPSGEAVLGEIARCTIRQRSEPLNSMCAQDELQAHAHAPAELTSL